jgi:hypothetical protein
MIRRPHPVKSCLDFCSDVGREYITPEELTLRAGWKKWSGRSSTASGALTAARTFQRKLAYDAFSAMAITA